MDTIKDAGFQIIWFVFTQVVYLASDFFLTGTYEFVFKLLSLVSVVFLILVNWEGAIKQVRKWLKRRK